MLMDQVKGCLLFNIFGSLSNEAGQRIWLKHCDKMDWKHLLPLEQRKGLVWPYGKVTESDRNLRKPEDSIVETLWC